MLDPTTKLRWRRRFKRSKKQVEVMGSQAEEQLERHFFRRLERLMQVRRFVISWLLLLLLLGGVLVAQTWQLRQYYLTSVPVSGGTYTEGILGNYTNANPLYASNNVDASVSRLLFAPLLSYNANNVLSGDLADRWEFDSTGTLYTVHLRPGLTWQDGQPLTAADVVFTYQTIQNPDAKSPLASSWQGITVEAKDDNTVTFKLPNVLAAFPYSLTNGIVPKHLLDGVPKTELRSLSFDTTNPIGDGPFKWQAIEIVGTTPETHEQRIALTANKRYFKGAPKLDKFVFRIFNDQKRLVDSFKKNELTAIAGLDTLPPELNNDSSIKSYSTPLTSEVMVFFNMSHDYLNDATVRKALVMGADTKTVLNDLGFQVFRADEPLLSSDIGYDKTLRQLSYNQQAAAQLLEQNGWHAGTDGIREKAGKKLQFGLLSQTIDEYTTVSETLQKQWKAIGIDVTVSLRTDVEVQQALKDHGYDTLLYGISLGVDPDVFAYWHSSQADLVTSSNRLNFSEYKSAVADRALEAGRTRTDPTLRALKYRPFLQAWHDDVPALALYQPRYLYISRGPVFGYDKTVMNTSTDRFGNVQNWMIRQTKASRL